MSNKSNVVPVDLKCTSRRCPSGEIEVSDPGEIFDGQEGSCFCGRVYVATSFTDGTMQMVFDKARTDRARKTKMFYGRRKEANYDNQTIRP